MIIDASQQSTLGTYVPGAKPAIKARSDHEIRKELMKVANAIGFNSGLSGYECFNQLVSLIFLKIMEEKGNKALGLIYLKDAKSIDEINNSLKEANKCIYAGINDREEFLKLDMSFETLQSILKPLYKLKLSDYQGDLLGDLYMEYA